MNFSISWQDIHGNWNITKWNSGTYSIYKTRTSPDLKTIGVDPVTAVLVTPYVHAIAGKYNSGKPLLEYQPNNIVGIYQVKGTTLNYRVEFIN